MNAFDFLWEEGLKMRGKLTYWDLLLNFAILYWNSKQRYKGIVRYISTKTLLVDCIGKSENMQYGRYRALSYTWVRWIVAEKCVKEPYSLKFLLPSTCGRFLITRRDPTLQMRHNYIRACWGKYPGYIVILIRFEQFTILVPSGCCHYPFYPNKDRAKPYKVMKLGLVTVPRECVSSEHGSLQQANDGWEDSHGLRCHLYLIP